MDFSLDKCLLFTNGIAMKLISLGLVLTKEKEEYYLLYSETYNSYYLAVKFDNKFYKLYRINKKKYDLFLNEAADVKFNEIVIKTYIIDVTINIINELHPELPAITVNKFKIIEKEDENI